MSLDYRKPNMTFAMLVMVLLIALLSPKTLLALELDISAAVIDVTEAGPAQQHKIFLSRLKKISNSLSRDEYEMVQGVLRGQTYKTTADTTLEEVMASLKREMAQGYKVLFECEGRDCGSSAEWANAVFSEPKLYGPESTQFYWVGKAAQTQTYWLVYGSKRSNKPVHFRIESIASVAPSLKSRLFAALSGPGHLRLAWTEVLADEAVLAEALGLWCEQSGSAGSRQVALAVSGGETLAPSAALESTGRLARALLTRLSLERLPGCQISAFGLGVLAPIQGMPSERLDLVLLP